MLQIFLTYIQVANPPHTATAPGAGEQPPGTPPHIHILSGLLCPQRRQNSLPDREARRAAFEKKWQACRQEREEALPRIGNSPTASRNANNFGLEQTYLVRFNRLGSFLSSLSSHWLPRRHLCCQDLPLDEPGQMYVRSEKFCEN